MTRSPKSPKASGTRAMVMHGTAKHTSGGLTAKDLKMVNGKYVSKRASASAAKNKNLGAFQKPPKRKGSPKSAFTKSPKRGTQAYKEVTTMM